MPQKKILLKKNRKKQVRNLMQDSTPMEEDLIALKRHFGYPEVNPSDPRLNWDIEERLRFMKENAKVHEGFIRDWIAFKDFPPRTDSEVHDFVMDMNRQAHPVAYINNRKFNDALFELMLGMHDQMASESEAARQHRRHAESVQKREELVEGARRKAAELNREREVQALLQSLAQRFLLSPNQEKAARSYLKQRLAVLDQEHERSHSKGPLRQQMYAGRPGPRAEYLAGRRQDIHHRVPLWEQELKARFSQKTPKQEKRPVSPPPGQALTSRNPFRALAGQLKPAEPKPPPSPKELQFQRKTETDFGKMMSALRVRQAHRSIATIEWALKSNFLSKEELVLLNKSPLSMRGFSKALEVRTSSGGRAFLESFRVEPRHAVEALYNCLKFLSATKHKRAHVVANLKVRDFVMPGDIQEQMYRFLLKNRILDDHHGNDFVMLDRLVHDTLH